MCLAYSIDNPEAKRLRRRIAGLGASAAALASVPALSFSHGHPLLGSVAIAAQACLITVAFGLIYRMRRLQK